MGRGKETEGVYRDGEYEGLDPSSTSIVQKPTKSDPVLRFAPLFESICQQRFIDHRRSDDDAYAMPAST